MTLLGCSVERHHRYPMPYLNSIKESEKFTDSLQEIGVERILVYHKKHGMSQRNFYIFWKGEELEIRLINANGVFKPNSWDMIGFYRDDRLFEFFQKYEVQLYKDSISNSNWLHYPYVDIKIVINDSVSKIYLPNGINSSENTPPYQFARLIESTLFNIEHGTYWQEAEKKMKYFPKHYDPTKEKWQNWEREKIDEGDLWNDYFH